MNWVEVEEQRNKELVWAAGRGEAREVQRLLNDGADIESRHHPPLGKFNNGIAEVTHINDNNGWVQVQFLPNFFEYSYRTNGKKFGRTALQAAADEGHADVLKFLIDQGANVNALAAREWGRTALQAAAQGGHTALVKLLLKKNAAVNGPVATGTGGRTELQAAAEAGHEDVVKILLCAGANPNTPASIRSGKAALPAAVQGGHEKVVRMLLRAEADVNALGIGDWGRTALQAAVERRDEKMAKLLILSGSNADVVNGALQTAAAAGDQKMVQFLLCEGAEINGGAGGKMALHEAAAHGREEMVQFLLNAGADFNAPAKNTGGTALQAAAEQGHEEVVKLLLCAGTDSNAAHTQVLAGGNEELSSSTKHHVDLALKDSVGQNILHTVCCRENVSLLHLLLEKSNPDVFNSKDFTGSTPLHIAVRNEALAAVILLIEKGVDMLVTDTSGKTPLQVALECGFSEIFQVLFKRSTRTDSLVLEDLPRILRLCGSEEGCKLAMIHHCPAAGRSIAGVSLGKTFILEWEYPGVESSSFYFRSSASVSVDFTDGRSFANPGAFLYRFAYPGPATRGTVVHWAWSILANRNMKFSVGIPNNQEILSLRPAEVILVAYICFRCPTETLTSEREDHEIQPFRSSTERVEISWIMRKAKKVTGESTLSLRSVHYRGTLNLKHLILPPHGAEFVALFFEDIYDRWMELIGRAKLHLNGLRGTQLVVGMGNPDIYIIIQCLLNDSQEWNQLRKNWQEHLLKMRGILGTFRQRDVLYTELIPSPPDHELQTGQEPKATNTEDLAPLRRLIAIINSFEEECGSALSELDKETKEMIEFELNLVSVYEARRSIDMSRSIKRLSWITFIFLPLVFVSGLFGMNVNLLANYPNWKWYIVIAVSFMIFVVGIWVMCKYLPITHFFEERFGRYLQSRFGEASLWSTQARGTPGQSPPASVKRESSRPEEPQLAIRTSTASVSGTITNWLRQRRNTLLSDVEESPGLDEEVERLVAN